MVKRSPAQKMKETKEDLLQKLIEQMSSVTKQIHHGVILQKPLLSPPHARLLFAIASKEKEGMSVKELAEQANVTPGAITQFVDILVKNKLVKRYEDPNDRRIVRLIPTEGTKAQIEKFRRDFLSSVAQAFDALSNDEIKQLIKLLSKVGSCPDLKQCDGVNSRCNHEQSKQT